MWVEKKHSDHRNAGGGHGIRSGEAPQAFDSAEGVRLIAAGSLLHYHRYEAPQAFGWQDYKRFDETEPARVLGASLLVGNP